MQAEDSPPRRPRTLRHAWTESRAGRFVARQLDAQITETQRAWDVVVGAVVPVLLVWLDRVWDPSGSDGVIPFGRVYVMTLAVLGSLAMVVFHTQRTRHPSIAALASPCLRLTSIAALGVGVVLLPISVIGVFFSGVGLLGFLPFVIAFVHWRCAVRARRLGAWGIDAALVVVLVVLGATAVFGKASKLLAYRDQEVLLGQRPGSESGALLRVRVLWHFPGVPLLRLQRAFENGDDATVERIDDLHVRITGRNAPWYDSL